MKNIVKVLLLSLAALAMSAPTQSISAPMFGDSQSFHVFSKGKGGSYFGGSGRSHKGGTYVSPKGKRYSKR